MPAVITQPRSIALLFAVLVGCSHAAPTPAAQPVPRDNESDRFEFKVRADFFDGVGGDTAALDRMMTYCEQVLASNSAHAEALVWHGAGLFGRASHSARAFRGLRTGVRSKRRRRRELLP